MTKSRHAQRLFPLKIIQFWVFLAYTKIKNYKQGNLYYFDESQMGADITIL
jgi:hypothetical protein